MIPIVTPAEMAVADATAPVPVEILIERAGAAVAVAALDLLGGGYGRRVVVLAGPGNNGADGRAAVPRLRRRGARVEVVEVGSAPARLPSADLVIDAAFGTGFRGHFDAPEVGATPVLAVDIPSGVDGLTGEERGRALPATRTVTFAALKPGLLMEPGRRLAGEVVLADIGLVAVADASVVEAGDVATWLPARASDRHKWNAAVLVVAGSPGMTGAAHLAAAAAQRAGAGMVRVGSPGLSGDPGCPIEAVGMGLPGVDWAKVVLEGLDRFHALVIGPGLGVAETTRAAVVEVVAGAPIPVVVDSDGLTALVGDVGGRLKPRSAGTVITPHDGEFERLMGAAPGPDRIAAARDLAAATGAVALLKGATTIVAHPGGAVRVVMSGDARLATAGTGDVLSGVIGALLAQGMAPLEAAAGAAWLHGRAAMLGAPEGLVASDVVDLLPAALTGLRNRT